MAKNDKKKVANAPKEEKVKKTAAKKSKKEISVSDVKNAKDISKNLFEIVEPIAPKVEETVIAPEIEETAPEIQETALDIWKSRLNKVSETAADTIPEEVSASELIEQIATPEPVPFVDPQEVFLEKWWSARNKPMSINHFELANSGININTFGASEGRVGKFKFTRRYAGENWTITVE